MEEGKRADEEQSSDGGGGVPAKSGRALWENAAAFSSDGRSALEGGNARNRSGKDGRVLTEKTAGNVQVSLYWRIGRV